MKSKKSRRPAPRDQRQPPPRSEAPKKPSRPQITLGIKNYLTMGAGLVAVAAGFITLAGGSTTLAPLLLVVGYCVIIPVGLLLR